MRCGKHLALAVRVMRHYPFAALYISPAARVRMCRWLAVAAVSISTSVALVNAATPTAAGPGGLTALPRFTVGPNLVRNAGFEDLNGALVAAWDAADGWSPDTRVRHSGAVSVRRLGHGPTLSQAVTLTTGVYTLSAWVKTDSVGDSADGGIRLVLDSRSAGINEWAASEIISGTTDWKLYEVGPVAIATDRTVRVRLESYHGQRGAAWIDDVTLARQLPSPLDVFMLYPNYRGMLFDDQPQAVSLDVSVTPPAGPLDRYAVAATLSEERSGAVIASRTYPAAATIQATVPAPAMRIGTPYVVEVALIEAARNAVVYTYPAFRVFKVSGATKAALGLTVDDKSRLLVRGAPRFVLGLYDAAAEYGVSESFSERRLWSPAGSRGMDAMNINMYLNSSYARADATAVNSLMTSLQKRGVLYLHTGGCVGATPAALDASHARLHDIAPHPARAGYYTVDDCANPAPHAFAHYQRLKQLDGDGIALAALAGGPAQLALWREAADVLATAVYPMYGPEPAAGYRHAAVADAAVAARQAVKSARPFMTVLPAGALDAAGRTPTLREMRSHAYMAIVEGARGLWWSALGEQATILPSVVNELAALEPVLVADDMPAALTSNSEAAAIRTKAKVVDSTGYLLAYNATSAPVTATFGWSPAAARAIVHAEDRAIAISAGRFSDTFEPYEAHVYVISSRRMPEGN
jgi:hypothetical protein